MFQIHSPHSLNFLLQLIARMISFTIVLFQSSPFKFSLSLSLSLSLILIVHVCSSKEVLEVVVDLFPLHANLK